MEIQINSNYKITSDTFNYMLQKRGIVENGKNKGEETYRTLGYFTTIESLFEGLIDKHLKESKCKNFKEVVDEIRLLKQDIYKALKPLKDIDTKLR